MGKLDYFTKNQAAIFSYIAKDPYFRSHFYFTGGTALSVVYLQHRESEDLDFFSEKPIDNQTLFEKVVDLSAKNSFTFENRQFENVRVYDLTFKNKETLKIDFVAHPYKRLEKGMFFEDFDIDSLSDIATNKLLTISQRTAPKDFVDLYFLLQKYTVWELMEGLRIKYRLKSEPFFIASDFLKVEEFEFLPKMIKPLTLSQLQGFFRKKAVELAKKVVE